jgi:hypothetical protein
MISIDFDYYKNSYLGDAIEEIDFAKLIKRARPFISQFTFGRVDKLEDDYEYVDKVRDCLCSISEVIAEFTTESGVEHAPIASESVGGVWSRTYVTGSDSESNSLATTIKSKVNLYLANTDLLYAGEWLF